DAADGRAGHLAVGQRHAPVRTVAVDRVDFIAQADQHHWVAEDVGRMRLAFLEIAQLRDGYPAVVDLALMAQPAMHDKLRSCIGHGPQKIAGSGSKLILPKLKRAR